MKLSTRHHAFAVATRVALCALIVGSGAMAAGLAGAPVAGATSAAPPWETTGTNYGSVGGLELFDSSGDPVTGGNLTDAPIAAYVEGSSTIRSGDTKATLYAYTPVSGVAPGNWAGEALSASTTYPNASAPSPLKSSALPVVTGSDLDEDLSQYITDFPNPDTSDDAYGNMYQLRLKTTAPGKSGTTTYDSADILVSGSTWSLVFPTTPTTTTLTTTPASPVADGSSVQLTATLSPDDATGSVQFYDGTSEIASPVTVSDGTASTTTSSLPTGTDELYAVYTPDSASGGDGDSASSGDTSFVVQTSTATPPSITTTSLPTGTVGTSYSTTLAATGGTAPLTWSVSGGTLPAGLTLDPSTGTISGTPTGAEVVSVTFEVVDENSLTDSVTLSLEVLDQPGVYVPLTPVRICDTRSTSTLTGDSAQCNNHTLAAGGTRNVDVAGEFGVPASDVTAVVVNVTEVGASGSGYFTVYPTGSTRPVTSNLNFVAGAVVPNLVEVGVGTSGEISLYSSAGANAIVDLEGYVTTTTAGGAGLYDALATPARICDTRAGNPSKLTSPQTQCTPSGSTDHLVGSTNPLTVQVTGDGGVPASGVSAVVLNVTVTKTQGAGYVTVYPQGATRPGASNVNFVTGQTIANRVIVPVGPTGEVTLFSPTKTDLIVDVSGYFTATGGTGDEFTPEPAPVRICDTRGGNPSKLATPNTQCNTDTAAGSAAKPIGGAATLSVQATGLAALPTGATAAVLNVTAIQPSAATYLTVHPGGALPTTSDLNATVNGVLANLVVATLTGSGAFDVYNAAGNTNVAIDVVGWYTAAGA